MDYVNNYAEIGGYGMSMPPPQLYYPEMNGGKGYQEGSPMDVMNPRYESSYYKDNRSQDRSYYDGGDYKQGGNKDLSPIDLNHFYDGGDFKHPSESSRDHRNVDYGSQHYFPNSATSYRSYARENRREKEMLARNGLYSPRDSCNKHNNYPTYRDDIPQTSSYWH